MQADRHARLRELFDSALKLDQASRRSFFVEACGDDAELRGELESLLRSVEASSADGELLSDRRIDRQRARLDGMLALDTAGREGCQGQAAGATVTGSASPGDRLALAAPPETIGPYRIKRAIASGGMGTVYEAEQESPRRAVALKVIRQGLTTPALLRRFELESQVLGRLQHPGIAQIYQAGTAQTDQGRQPYFAMEFVRGTDLREFVRRDHLSTRQRLELLARICDAVHHAHQKGVIHRDLKPSNILVDESGQPKILDFGVARVTDSDVQVTTVQTDVGQLIGTLQYMSPEQVSADPHEIDTRSDVYSLGVIAYEILTGQVPYDLKNKMIHEAARIIREEELTRLSTINRTLRGDIETIVVKALQKEKTRRYQSAAELAEDIRRYLHHEPITARPPSTWYNLSKFTRRNKTLVGGVAMTFVALVAGVIASTTFGIRAEAQARKASREAEKSNRTANFATAMFEGLTPDEAKGKDTTLLRGILDEAAARIDKELGDEPEIEAMMRDHIGTVYRKLALFDDADQHLPKALAMRRQVLGDLNSQTLSTMGRVAHLRLSQGREQEAIALFREAYAKSCEVEGRESRMAISHLDSLGGVMRDLERLVEAETYLREAVDLATTHLPPDDDIRISSH